MAVVKVVCWTGAASTGADTSQEGVASCAKRRADLNQANLFRAIERLQVRSKLWSISRRYYDRTFVACKEKVRCPRFTYSLRFKAGTKLLHDLSLFWLVPNPLPTASFILCLMTNVLRSRGETLFKHGSVEAIKIQGFQMRARKSSSQFLPPLLLS